MKRGLVLLDPTETTTEELHARVADCQQLLQARGIDFALIYGDVYRSGDITYLSNLCIYWNEGVLLVPAEQDPVFLTKLSRRVHPWMRANSIIEDLRSGTDLAQLVADYVKAQPAGVIGLAEMNWWPASVIEALRAKLPGWELRDLQSAIREKRQIPSASEQKLLLESAKVSARAVAAGLDDTLSNPERAGAAERVARMAGVEDIFVYCYESGSHADTVEVISEYRGYWTTAARVIAKESVDWANRMEVAYGALVHEIRAGTDINRLYAQLEAMISEDDNLSWKVDLVHHTDLETQGDYRLPEELDKPIPAGSVVGLRLVCSFADGTEAVMADTFAVEEHGANRLTGDLPIARYQPNQK
ncbi:aminopeptidase P family N-terminal domain-containing protein [Alicyclobacillus suci]|uniref:aminopeptidase P family N-terminal domain-containing protein n=1 Tax=Alicyclobacillus suci TaxID=2816080 RepID=UPI001A8C4177|nr:aminopeptidase P family N-terminal domain-containing protein [Alicyclobacillus suci]